MYTISCEQIIVFSLFYHYNYFSISVKSCVILGFYLVTIVWDEILLSNIRDMFSIQVLCSSRNSSVCLWLLFFCFVSVLFCPLLNVRKTVAYQVFTLKMDCISLRNNLQQLWVKMTQNELVLHLPPYRHLMSEWPIKNWYLVKE